MDIKVELTDGLKFEYPPILYKYRDWENSNHKSVLTNNALYMASPRSFEDIKDCNIPEKFPQKQELYRFFLEKSKKDNPGWSRKTHRQFATYWSKQSPLANPQRLKYLIKHFNDDFNNRFGVLSMTANRDNDEMWHKYANDHKGFCVGYDTKILFKHVGGGGPVQYADELPVIDFMKDDFETKHAKNIFFKETKWAFEEEYRLHTMWPQAATLEQRNIILPEDCLVEIILGKLMPEKSKDEIKKIAKEKYPKATITENV